MDEELRAEILSLITETLQSTVKDAVRSALQPALQSQQSQFEQLKSEISETISESSSQWLDNLIEEADEHISGSTDDEDDGDEEPSERYTELEGALTQLKRQLDEEKKLRTDAETRSKQEIMQNTALDAIQKTGKVLNAKQLLRILQEDGKVFEQDGQLVTHGKDEYGIKTIAPLSEAIEGFLNSDDYSHFAAARPGTGTGAVPASGTAATNTGKWFGSDKMPTPEQIMNPEFRQQMLAELEAASRS